MSDNNLRMLRKQKRLTQQQLGEIIGVTQQSVGAWERGKTQPDTQNLIALSKLYNVSVDYIMGQSKDAHIQSTSTTDDELRTWAIDRVQSLSHSELLLVRGYLEGLLSSRDNPPGIAAAHDPAAQSSE